MLPRPVRNCPFIFAALQPGPARLGPPQPGPPHPNWSYPIPAGLSPPQPISVCSAPHHAFTLMQPSLPSPTLSHPTPPQIPTPPQAGLAQLDTLPLHLTLFCTLYFTPHCTANIYPSPTQHRPDLDTPTQLVKLCRQLHVKHLHWTMVKHCAHAVKLKRFLLRRQPGW